MLLVLFVLALFAGYRGWFPWSIVIFGLAYTFTIVDYGAISHASSLSSFGINASAGSMLELVSCAALSAMSLFGRS